MLSPAAIARIKLSQAANAAKKSVDTSATDKNATEEKPNFVLQGVGANNLLLLQFASAKQYDLALSLFRTIQYSADTSQFDRGTEIVFLT
jgi:hypothetical protein